MLKHSLLFLAVQNSSIGDLVTHWLTDSLTDSFTHWLTHGTFTFDIQRATLETWKWQWQWQRQRQRQRQNTVSHIKQSCVKNNDNETEISNISNVTQSDSDYEWWINNQAYITHQAQINSQPHLYEKPNIQFLILNPTEHNFIAGFFQDKSIGNLSSLSQTLQKAILKLSKGNPNLPIVNLQQLYGIIKN